MKKKSNRFFELKDNLKKTESILSIPLIEAIQNDSYFTVAISTHKRADLLKETIESVLDQISFNNYTILVVDDNPERNDDTEILMSTYTNKNISYYKNSSNMGMSGTWNRLFSLAKSEYVVLLHDDDMLYPDALFSMYTILEKTNKQYAAYCSRYEVYDMEKMEKIPDRKPGSIEILNLKTLDFMYGNVAGPPSGVCMRRQIVLDMGGYSKEFGLNLDYDFYVKMSHYYPICIMDKYPLLIYRIKDNVSAKRETLIEMACNDTKIRTAIVQNENILKRFLWKSFIRIQTFKIIESLKYMYHNYSFDTKTEFKQLGLDYTKLDSLIYRLMLKCYFPDKKR